MLARRPSAISSIELKEPLGESKGSQKRKSTPLLTKLLITSGTTTDENNARHGHPCPCERQSNRASQGIFSYRSTDGCAPGPIAVSLKRGQPSAHVSSFARALYA